MSCPTMRGVCKPHSMRFCSVNVTSLSQTCDMRAYRLIVAPANCCPQAIAHKADFLHLSGFSESRQMAGYARAQQGTTCACAPVVPIGRQLLSLLFTQNLRMPARGFCVCILLVLCNRLQGTFLCDKECRWWCGE